MENKSTNPALNEKETFEDFFRRFDGFVRTPQLFSDQQPIPLLDAQISLFDFEASDSIEIEFLEADQTLIKRRLGHQAERFFQLLLEATPDFELILSNIQIHELGNKTIGEFDFILRDPANQVMHVELAYKHYLFDPEMAREEVLAGWIGPNRKDRLMDKMGKLNTRQFPLLFHELAKPILAQHALNSDVIQQHLCLKAKLYVPYFYNNLEADDAFRDLNLDSSINSAAIAGYWLRMQDLKTDQFADARFYLLPKWNWFLRPDSNSIADYFFGSLDSIESQLKNLNESQIAPLIWIKTGDSNKEKIISCYVVWW